MLQACLSAYTPISLASMLIVKQDEFGLVLRDTEIGGIRCALMEYHTHRFCQLVEAETLIERMDSLSCPFLYFKQPASSP
jgi:hypothetical protein